MSFRLYREPQDKEVTVIGADPSEGGKSYCAAVAKSKKQADSFMVYHAKVKSTEFGHELYKMAVFIKRKTGKWPVIGVERNVGTAAIYVLQMYNYPQLFRMKEFNTKENKEERKIGWNTNSQSRPKMLGDIALALRQGATRIYDKETVREFMRFIISERSGRAQAAAGKNDDLVMAEAIAWQMYQVAKPLGLIEEDHRAIINKFPKQHLFDKRGFYHGGSRRR